MNVHVCMYIFLLNWSSPADSTYPCLHLPQRGCAGECRSQAADSSLPWMSETLHMSCTVHVVSVCMRKVISPATFITELPSSTHSPFSPPPPLLAFPRALRDCTSSTKGGPSTACCPADSWPGCRLASPLPCRDSILLRSHSEPGPPAGVCCPAGGDSGTVGLGKSERGERGEGGAMWSGSSNSSGLAEEPCKMTWCLIQYTCMYVHVYWVLI